MERPRFELGDLMARDPGLVEHAMVVDPFTGIDDPLGQLPGKLKRLSEGKTVIIRTTVVQEAREVFRAPCYCRVQLITPAGAHLFFELDEDPKDIGLDRLYKLPTIPPQVTTHPFGLAPGQTVVAAAYSGTVSFSLLVQPTLIADLAQTATALGR